MVRPISERLHVLCGKHAVTFDSSEVIQRAGRGSSCSSGTWLREGSFSTLQCLVPFQHVASVITAIRHQKNIGWCRSWGEPGILSSTNKRCWVLLYFEPLDDDWLFSLVLCTTKITNLVIISCWCFFSFWFVFLRADWGWSSGYEHCLLSQKTQVQYPEPT